MNLKILSLCLLIFASTFIAQSKNKLPVIFDNNPVYDIESVTRTDTATIVTFMVEATQKAPALNAIPFLVDPHKQSIHKFLHGHIDNQSKTPISKNQYVAPGDRVVMFFDPIAADATEISFFDFEREHYSITGIRLDSMPYCSANLPQAPDLRRPHLPAFQFGPLDYAYIDLDIMSPCAMSTYSNSSNPFAPDLQAGWQLDTDSMSHATGSRLDMIPTRLNLEINGRSFSWIAVPGTTTRIAFDSPGYAEAVANGADRAVASEQAFRIYEAPIPEFYTTRRYDVYQWNSTPGHLFSLTSYNEYLDSIRSLMQRRNDAIVADASLSGAEKEYLQLYSEGVYISQRPLFLKIKNIMQASEEEMARYQAEYSPVDSIAPSLLSATHPGAIYVHVATLHDNDVLEYLYANGLDDAPFYQTMQKYSKIVDAVVEKRVTDIKSDPSLGICEMPECPPDRVLPIIVSGHRGRTVVVDLWATWCGPCKRSMADLQPYKDELQANGVDFVYITNESSPQKAWYDELRHHKGFHYLIPNNVWERMDIPNFRGSIPHYLVYRPDGTLHYSRTGWSGPEELLAAIEEARQFGAAESEKAVEPEK